MVRGMPHYWFRKHLRFLAECGIELAPGVTVADVKREFDQDRFTPDTTLYEAFLCVLGGELHTKALSNDIFYFDIECIYDPGDYVAIAEKVKLLAGDSLPIEDLSDNLAWDDCWLAFRLGDEDLKLELGHHGDYADTNVFVYLAAILDELNAPVRLACHEMLQDCLYGCFTPEQLEKLNDEGAMEFEWV